MVSLKPFNSKKVAKVLFYLVSIFLYSFVWYNNLFVTLSNASMWQVVYPFFTVIIYSLNSC